MKGVYETMLPFYKVIFEGTLNFVILLVLSVEEKNDEALAEWGALLRGKRLRKFFPLFVLCVPTQVALQYLVLTLSYSQFNFSIFLLPYFLFRIFLSVYPSLFPFYVSFQRIYFLIFILV